eukprot:Phypoly_transcript_10194.p1 GENE.Phypoly_transcript_10194~~Phypoly_transcript_10194.p1  ORF type:complete len:360 (-),score=80.25 Phypoly_transcript_10194:216-1295(-)
MAVQGDPRAVEQQHVTEVYDLIAAHFSSTRYKAWPRVENFLNSLEKGAILADVGCGNGKYLGVNPNTFAIGSDRSGKFAEICAEKGFESMICDNLYLPYRDSCFDSVISIAVVHHFASPERRLQAIKELIRILRKGGKLLFTVWAIQQDWKNKQYGEQDVMIPWHFREDFKKKTEKKTRPGRLKKKEERRDKVQQKIEEDKDNAEAKRESRRKKSEKKEEREEDFPEILDTNDNSNTTTTTKNEIETNTQLQTHTDTKIESRTKKESEKTSDTIATKTESDTTKSESHATTGTKPESDTKTETKTDTPGDSQQYDVYHRYYHLFKEGEIEDLFTKIPHATLLEVVLDHDNWYVIVQKES